MSLSERKLIQAPKHESGQKATQSLRNIFAEERKSAPRIFNFRGLWVIGNVPCMNSQV